MGETSRGDPCRLLTPPQPNRRHALDMRDKEEREMPKSDEILTEAEVETASNILTSAVSTIRSLAAALEHAHEVHWVDRSDCDECDAGKALLARYQGGK